MLQQILQQRWLLHSCRSKAGHWQPHNFLRGPEQLELVELPLVPDSRAGVSLLWPLILHLWPHHLGSYLHCHPGIQSDPWPDPCWLSYNHLQTLKADGLCLGYQHHLQGHLSLKVQRLAVVVADQPGVAHRQEPHLHWVNHMYQQLGQQQMVPGQLLMLEEQRHNRRLARRRPRPPHHCWRQFLH